jgi:hypothetical protein
VHFLHWRLRHLDTIGVLPLVAMRFNMNVSFGNIVIVQLAFALNSFAKARKSLNALLEEGIYSSRLESGGSSAHFTNLCFSSSSLMTFFFSTNLVLVPLETDYGGRKCQFARQNTKEQNHQTLLLRST